MAGKPNGPFTGNSATITARIEPELKEAIEREAAATNHSISQTIQILLRRALTPKGPLERVGSPRVRALARIVAKVANDAEAMTGESWRTDRFTFDVTAAGIHLWLEHLAPKAEPNVPKRIADRAAAGWHSQDDPKALATSLFLGTLDGLRSVEPPLNPPAGMYFGDNWYLLSRIRDELSTDGDAP